MEEQSKQTNLTLQMEAFGCFQAAMIGKVNLSLAKEKKACRSLPLELTCSHFLSMRRNL